LNFSYKFSIHQMKKCHFIAEGLFIRKKESKERK